MSRRTDPREITRRQGGVFWKSSAELRAEIAAVERMLTGLKRALRDAELREAVQEAGA